MKKENVKEVDQNVPNEKEMELTTHTKLTLVIKYDIVDEEDETKTTSQKFSNLKTATPNAELQKVGAAIAKLINSNSIFLRKEEDFIFN